MSILVTLNGSDDTGYSYPCKPCWNGTTLLTGHDCKFRIFFFFSFAVPAFQFLGAMPLAVMKGSMSKLVEPQEQGNVMSMC